MSTIQTMYPCDDRRGAMRFPIAGDLHYLVRREAGDTLRGTGHVQDISSTGIAFHTDEPLQPGWTLQISMDWPARLNGSCPLRLVFEGAILRVEGDLMVVSVERPEFRTAGKGMSIAPRRSGIVAMPTTRR